MFHNRIPEDLPTELATARRLGVSPSRVSDPGFAQLVNDDTVKWVLTLGGELLFIPERVNGQELAHPIMTDGAPVLAAGEAELTVLDGEIWLIMLTNYSGHYRPNLRSLSLARQAFAAAGINILQGA